jgi:NAD-dependent dihydropyrimidine dehydrogenase PreA subunit
MPETRSTESCKLPPGVVSPVIDRTRCEGKEECVVVCPYDVFEVRVLSRDERSALPFFARIKAAFHGNCQAFAVRAELCHSCGLCVEACPESAIRLERHPPP